MTEAIKTSLESLKAFLAYFGSSMAMFFIFVTIYTVTTPYSELLLVRRQRNTAAAITYTGAIAGIAIPLGRVVAHSTGLLHMIIWGAIAMAIQILAYSAIRFLVFPNHTRDIIGNNIPNALALAAFSVTTGYINAMCIAH